MTDRPKREVTIGSLKIIFGWDISAGLIQFCGDGWSFHILIQPKHWIWGYEPEEYDRICDYWGAGPLALFVKLN
jgi:hypothetical protein